MPEILLHLLAATLYLSLAAHFWRTRWRGPVLNRPPRSLSAVERGCLCIPLVLHGFVVVHEIFGSGHMRFGFALAISLMLWLALALYWVESLYTRLDGLQMLGLPLAAGGVLLPLAFPSPHLVLYADSPLFRAHFLIAMLAYSLFTLAALHALLMMAAERNLHRGRVPRLIASLPPLLTMETLLFRLVHIAFALLTLTLLSGCFFAEEIFGKALSFDHKTVFALLSWLIFAALLLGRHLRGWRGRIALHWTLAGFITLLLAYIGTRFVLEVLLHRLT